MYDTLIMLKPGPPFTADDLHALVVDALMGGSAEVQRDGNAIHVTPLPRVPVAL
jgi:hypothetical protein